MTNIRRCLAVTFVTFCIFVSMIAGCPPSQRLVGVTEVFNTQGVSQTVVKPVGQNIGERFAAEPAKKPLMDRGSFSTSFLILQRMYDLVAVPTYDGYSQAVHPKVLYFPKRWNGCGYWMSVTPYPFGNNDYGNPYIVTSNDGETWVALAGLKNPITGIPSDMKIGAHYSDSRLMMCDNKMEMWYRYNKGNPEVSRADFGTDYYYRAVSKDGLNWSALQLIQKSNKGLINLAVDYEDKKYKFWYTAAQKRLVHTESIDGAA